MCCCTSATSLPPSCSTTTALYSSGMDSGSNSTSSTGPITCTTRPVAFLSTFDFLGAALDFVAIGFLSVECFGTADDFGELLRDLALPRPVIRPLEDVEHLTGVIGRVLHRGP